MMKFLNWFSLLSTPYVAWVAIPVVWEANVAAAMCVVCWALLFALDCLKDAMGWVE